MVSTMAKKQMRNDWKTILQQSCSDSRHQLNYCRTKFVILTKRNVLAKRVSEAFS